MYKPLGKKIRCFGRRDPRLWAKITKTLGKEPKTLGKVTKILAEVTKTSVQDFGQWPKFFMHLDRRSEDFCATERDFDQSYR